MTDPLTASRVGCDIAISIANVQSGRASILARQHDADLPTVTRRSTVKLWGVALRAGRCAWRGFQPCKCPATSPSKPKVSSRAFPRFRPPRMSFSI